MGMVIKYLYILRQSVREHCMDAFFIAVFYCLLVVPAFKTDCVKDFLHFLNFLFECFFLSLKEFVSFGIGFTSLRTPLHKLFNIFDFQTGFLEAFDYVKRLNLFFIKFSYAGISFHSRE